jgi:antitoxin component YwqK of YwqJK toxin-antitoxin module
MKVDYNMGIKDGFREIYADSGIIRSREIFKDDKRESWSSFFDEKGNLKARIFYNNDLEDGFSAEFSSDGRIININEFKDGVILRKTRVNRYNQRNLKTGIWVETDSSYHILKSIQYENDLKNGYLKEYDTQGNLVKLSKYIDDILQANDEELSKVKLQRSYYKNGNVKSQGAYLNNQPVGLHTFYDSTGAINKAAVFNQGIKTAVGDIDEQGRKQGEWSEFYPSGEIKSKGKYLDDLKSGPWEYFYEEGQSEQLGSYQNGVPSGIWKWYYPSGKLLREENYVIGKEDGFSFELNESGDTLSAGDYYRGDREGRWIFKYGDQRIIGNFAADEMNGVWIHYFENGNKSFEGEFRASLAEGKHKSWYENGDLKWTGKYVSGIRDGIWTKYSPEGIMELSITYEMGVEKKYNGIKFYPEFFPADYEILIEKNPYIF